MDPMHECDLVIPLKKATIFVPWAKHPGRSILDGIVFDKGCFYAGVVKYMNDVDGETVTLEGPRHIVEPIIHELMALVMS